MCWYMIGSPPLAALKKLVPKWRSVSVIVTAPASTGITAISRYAVISQAQQNIGIFISFMPGARRFRIVTMMLIAPMIDDAPMMWIEKIVESIAMPICSDSGEYMVQPVAGAPPGMKKPPTSISAAGISSQKLRLFMRANAVSGAPICSWSPGSNSSARITIAIAPPMISIVNANSRYIVPMSLWLVANTQRRQPVGAWAW